MNYLKTAAPALVALSILALTTAARAQDLYATGFEAPQYQAGQPLAGQNSWGEFGGYQRLHVEPSDAGFITTNHPASGRQSLQINGSALNFNTNAGQYQNYISPSMTWNFSQYPTVRLDAEVRLDGPSTGSTEADDLISTNLQVSNQNDHLAAIWISSNGHVQYYSDADRGPTGDGYLGPAVRLGQYYDLSMLLNTGTLTDSFYVDGQYIGSLAMPSTAVSDNSFNFGAELNGLVNQSGYDHTQYTSYFDNVNLAAVPEPGAAAIFISLGLTTAAACLRRKRAR